MKISIGLWLLYPESVNVILRYRIQEHENPNPCHKKYRVHQGLRGLFDLVWLLYFVSLLQTPHSV